MLKSILKIILIFHHCLSKSEGDITSVTENIKNRQGRSIAFPSGSSFGYLVAVAVPLEVLSRNVFVSFNFEANYALPTNETHNDFIKKWDTENIQDNVIDNEVIKLSNKRSVNKDIFYTRKLFYKTIIKHLNNFDLNGVQCLYRTICEISAANLSIHNGLLGLLVNVLFLPSHSQEEEISTTFHRAEIDGRDFNCGKFTRNCPISLLDLISVLKL